MVLVKLAIAHEYQYNAEIVRENQATIISTIFENAIRH
jgi:hypothetical protein